MLRLLGCAAAAALIAGISPARADLPEDAKRLGEIFCLLGEAGGEFGRMYLVTRSLTEAINQAQKKNGEIAAATPGEKPPLGDGVPYQSFPDEAPVCKVGKLADKGRNQELEILYEFPETPKGNWTDRLLLIVEDGRLRIDDVLFGPGESGDGLRKALAPLLEKK
jgi:hypothetical protein